MSALLYVNFIVGGQLIQVTESSVMPTHFTGENPHDPGIQTNTGKAGKVRRAVGHKTRQEEAEQIIEGHVKPAHTEKAAAKVAARKKELATNIKSLEQHLATQVEASKNREIDCARKTKSLEQQYEKTNVQLKHNPTDLEANKNALLRNIKSLEEQNEKDVQSKRDQYKVSESEGGIEEALVQEVRKEVMRKTGIKSGESGGERFLRMQNIMCEISGTTSCNPFKEVHAQRSGARNFGAKTVKLNMGSGLTRELNIQNKQGHEMHAGDYICSGGGHCVFKSELVELFGMDDVSGLLTNKTMSMEESNALIDKNVKQEWAKPEMQEEKNRRIKEYQEKQAKLKTALAKLKEQLDANIALERDKRSASATQLKEDARTLAAELADLKKQIDVSIAHGEHAQQQEKSKLAELKKQFDTDVALATDLNSKQLESDLKVLKADRDAAITSASANAHLIAQFEALQADTRSGKSDTACIYVLLCRPFHCQLQHWQPANWTHSNCSTVLCC